MHSNHQKDGRIRRFQYHAVGRFSLYGVGPLYKIERIMNADVYVNILQTVLLSYVDEEIPLRWLYMQNNDPN